MSIDQKDKIVNELFRFLYSGPGCARLVSLLSTIIHRRRTTDAVVMIILSAISLDFKSHDSFLHKVLYRSPQFLSCHSSLRLSVTSLAQLGIKHESEETLFDILTLHKTEVLYCR